MPISYGGNPNPPDGGGNVYDSETDPADLGSGGGTGAGSSFGRRAAGAGGGAVLLVVGGNLQLDGLITADGTGPGLALRGARRHHQPRGGSASGAGARSAGGGFGYGAGGRANRRQGLRAIGATWSVTVDGQSAVRDLRGSGSAKLAAVADRATGGHAPCRHHSNSAAAVGVRAGTLTALDGLVWGVDDPAVATVDASGLLTTVACGATRVTASLGGVVGFAPLKVCSDVYVSTAGDDASGDGSAGNPYRTITFALSHSWPANTVVHLAPGTYSAGETFPLRPADGITLAGAGPDQTTIAGNVSAISGPPVGI
jgi:hypothetical protein